MKQHKKKYAQPAGQNPIDSLNNFYFKSFACCLIAVLGIIVYSNTFHCPFQFDDEVYIVHNLFIRNAGDLLNIWAFYPCRFVAFLSITANYQLDGLNIFGYHFFNLLVHLSSAILVWWFVLLTLATPAMKDNRITQHANLIALLAGLIFVSHPVQIEAVTYICQRAASMAAFFYLLSLCFYIKSRLLEHSPLFYILSLITAVLAMFTKENVITLPLMMVLYEFYFFENKRGLNWTRLSPLLLTMIIVPLTTLLTESNKVHELQSIAQGPGGISPMQYFLTELRVMMTYIRLIFIPLHQNLDYDYPIFKSFFELPVLFSFVTLMAILFGAKQFFSKYRLVSFSILWFFLTLLPESSVLPQKDIIFEHRLYLPLVGYGLFLASALYYLFGKNNINMMILLIAMIIAGNSVLTYQRNKVWQDELTLWKDTLQKSPHKARPYHNLGRSYDDQGNLDEAMVNYNKAIAIDPLYADAYYNRGMIYYNREMLEPAMNDFTKTIEIDPMRAAAYNSRGNVYNKQSKLKQAMADYNKAIDINPEFAEGYNDRGVVEGKENNFTAAIADFARAIQINPQYAEAYNNRGITYYKLSNLTQAMADFSKAIDVDPKYTSAYNNRAVISNILERQKK